MLNKIIKIFAIIILSLIVVLIVLEIFGIRINPYYFQKCQPIGGRFGDICPHKLFFIPK